MSLWLHTSLIFRHAVSAGCVLRMVASGSDYAFPLPPLPPLPPIAFSATRPQRIGQPGQEASHGKGPIVLNYTQCSLAGTFVLLVHAFMKIVKIFSDFPTSAFPSPHHPSFGRSLAVAKV